VSTARIGSLAALLACWPARHSWSPPVFIGDSSLDGRPELNRRGSGNREKIPGFRRCRFCQVV